MKNLEALKRAIAEKLEAQREFAAHYRGLFQPGGNGSNQHKSKGASSGAIAPDDYCQQYGFAKRSVQRWAEKLLPQEGFEVELERQLAKVVKLLEMFQAASYSSESAEWYTPPEYLDAVRGIAEAD